MRQRNIKRMRRVLKKQSGSIIAEFVKETYKMPLKSRLRVALAVLFGRPI